MFDIWHEHCRSIFIPETQIYCFTVWASSLFLIVKFDSKRKCRIFNRLNSLFTHFGQIIRLIYVKVFLMQVMVNKLDKSFAERDSRRNFKRFSILRGTCMIHNGAIQTFFGATMRRIFLFFFYLKLIIFIVDSLWLVIFGLLHQRQVRRNWQKRYLDKIVIF